MMMPTDCQQHKLQEEIEDDKSGDKPPSSGVFLEMPTLIALALALFVAQHQKKERTMEDSAE